MKKTKTEKQPQNALDEKPDYGDIVWLEEPPRDDWFFEKKDDQGELLVYLRFRATGMLPRLFGPFASRAAALWCLDSLVNDLWEPLDGMAELTRTHALNRPFNRKFFSVIVEDPLVAETHQSRPPESSDQERAA